MTLLSLRNIGDYPKSVFYPGITKKERNTKLYDFVSRVSVILCFSGKFLSFQTHSWTFRHLGICFLDILSVLKEQVFYEKFGF